jgi:hypothetical protein
MKKSLFLFLLLIATAAAAQKKPVAEISKLVTRPQVEAPLAFLSADEMRGRDTGSRELDIAANYITSVFRQLGLKEIAGAPNYSQAVALVKAVPVAAATLQIGSEALAFKDQFIVVDGARSTWSGECVYVGYGAVEDMPADIKGKMVLSIAGTKEAAGAQAIFNASSEKFKRVKAAGGAGLIEFFVTTPFPWPSLVSFFSGNPRTTVKKDGADIPRVWMKDVDVAAFKDLKEKKTGTISISIDRADPIAIPSRNIVGVVEGTDPALKQEYMVVSAHYDHVGVGAKKANDSIYNGARDNALGTVAMMTAAKYFAQFPAKRSIIFVALTGEERGLLGSAWYAEHPLIPLKQTVFNMDCDGAGYNDKSVVTIIGLERTTAEADISKACEAFGLKATKDPVPEQNLYERSDNYNFALKGVPAIDFAPGVKAFDAELMKYYHQPADEVGSLDFDYLVLYYRAFIYANHLIANAPKAPFWKPGDKFEATGKALYQK